MSWPRQLVFRAAFDRHEIAALNRMASKLPMSTDDQTIKDPRVRYGEARWLHPGRRTQRFFDRLADIFEAANREFGYHVEGFREPLLHVTYPPGGHFDWHTDAAQGSMATRKLSVSVLLSAPDEYAGGELEFCPGGGLRNGTDMGTAIVFPSFMAHRITPVTDGRRVALVSWMHGKEFR